MTEVAVLTFSRNKNNILMLGVILWALFVGLYSLGDARISHDELKTLQLIKDASSFEVLTHFYSFSHVFFSFLLDVVHWLTDKFYFLRAMPVLFGVLAVAMTYRAGKALLGSRVALVAAFFLIITPLFTEYLREMRGYSATVFFGMAVLFSLWQGVAGWRQGLAHRQKGYWFGLIIASILGVYTHLYFALILVTVTLIIAVEWLAARKAQRPQAVFLKPAIFSLLMVGLGLAILYAPIIKQVLAVPEEQALRTAVFGPFSPTWDFWRQFVAVFHFFSPLDDFYSRVDVVLGLVLLGCLSGLSHQARRRSTVWLILWWLTPFLTNLLVMVMMPGSSAQIRFHLHTLPAYLLLGSSGLLVVLDQLNRWVKAAIPANRIRLRPWVSMPGLAAILVLAVAIPETVRSLDEKTDEAWSAVAAYLSSEVRAGDVILCEAFELHGGRGGNDGSCGWQLHDVEKLIKPPLPNQSLDYMANYRGSERRRDVLQNKGRVWFVIYFKGATPYPLDVLRQRSKLAVKQFRSTWAVRVDSGETLLDNLIETGHWLLEFVPDEKHQFGYHLDLAQLYALAGDMAAANPHLEQARRIQQQSSDPDWGPELARLREVVAVVRFYAPVDPSPQHTVAVNFDNRLQLYGYSVEPDRLAKPEAVKVSFYWQMIRPLEKDYTVLMHLQDAGGQTVGYFDFQPFDAILPTSQWPVGTELREARQFPLPEELPPGQYTLVIGLYSPETMNRLRIIDDSSGENVFKLGTVTVAGS